jgi:hypothetical protein
MRAFTKASLMVFLVFIVVIFLFFGYVFVTRSHSSNNDKYQGTLDPGQGVLDTESGHVHAHAHDPEETQDAADHEDEVKQQENPSQDVLDLPLK